MPDPMAPSKHFQIHQWHARTKGTAVPTAAPTASPIGQTGPLGTVPVAPLQGPALN